MKLSKPDYKTIFGASVLFTIFTYNVIRSLVPYPIEQHYKQHDTFLALENERYLVKTEETDTDGNGYIDLKINGYDLNKDGVVDHTAGFHYSGVNISTGEYLTYPTAIVLVIDDNRDGHIDRTLMDSEPFDGTLDTIVKNDDR